VNKSSELKLCGLAAVRARWRRDPSSIQRLFFDYETGRRIGVMCRALAAAKKVYRCLEPAELEKVSGSLHHGGIVAVVREPELRSPSPSDIQTWAGKKSSVLILDRIGNPHNLGALARTAAYFGVPHLVIPSSPDAAVPNEASYRVSEGGLEAIAVWQVPDLPSFQKSLAAAGFDVLGAATRGGQPLTPRLARNSAKVPRELRRPAALVLGNEENGMSASVSAACTRLVTLAGSGEVESLNVSVAGAVLIWELLA
jgi:TrmH RNA methyltransferase